MKANVKLIRKRRSYSKEFKQKLDQEFELAVMRFI